MIPIFIITCDRLEVLKKCVKSMDKIETPHEIVFVDFNTTYKPTLQWMVDSGHEIYYERKIKDSSQLDLVCGPVEEYFKKHPKSKYVVTDCDIELNCKGDILDKYSEILDSTLSPKDHPREKSPIGVVGPMLEVQDIPNHYPKKDMVQVSHLRFWQKGRSLYCGLEAIYDQIDTTFGMYREGLKFKRLQMGLRTMPPYSAKHLPWYSKELTEDEVYYKKHNQNHISSW